MKTYWRFHSVGLAAALVCAGACFGQRPQPLTLDECIRRALSVPSAVSLARQDRIIAERERIQARAGFLPISGVNFGYTYNSPALQDRSTFSFVALNGVREFVILGNIFQEIDTSGRLRADYARARANQQASAAPSPPSKRIRLSFKSSSAKAT